MPRAPRRRAHWPPPAAPAASAGTRCPASRDTPSLRPDRSTSAARTEFSRLPCAASLSSHRFEQELEDLELPFRFREILAPGVQPVTANQKAVDFGMLAQLLFDARRRRTPVLRVVDDRQPFAMLVRANALQSLQHFIPFDLQPAGRLAHGVR